MAAKRSKNAEHEKLDDANIERVIAYLEEKGATKKVACDMLNIAYNTARLTKLLETYVTKREDNKRRRAEKRGKPATPQEVAFIIEEYLAGEPIANISKSSYRGSAFIHTILDEYSVPERRSSPNYFKPNLIPDGAVKTKFAVGEKVYSARYDVLADIEKEYEKGGESYYRIYLRGDWQQYAYQPWYELASLDPIRQAGVQI